MNISICSYSFHRLLKAGKQDLVGYVIDCRALGCTQLDPWSGHFTELSKPDDASILNGVAAFLTVDDEAYLQRVKAAAIDVGLPFGCIAVDGAHIYEAQEEDRRKRRWHAYRWIEIGKRLGANQLRIDAGGPEEPTDDIWATIFEGYADVIRRANAAGLEVLVENHWGPTRHPNNVVRLLEAVPQLGLLLDSYNWAGGKQGQGWLMCAKYAKLTHIKTFQFTEEGDELTQNIQAFIRLLKQIGYKGCWGVESVPTEIGEMEAARRSIKLIERYA